MAEQPPMTDEQLEAIRGRFQMAINDHRPKKPSTALRATDMCDLLDEVDRLRAELEATKDARAAESDEYVTQLRRLPGWCRACPPGCDSCLGPDCECYEHDEPASESPRPPAEEGERRVGGWDYSNGLPPEREALFDDALRQVLDRQAEGRADR